MVQASEVTVRRRWNGADMMLKSRVVTMTPSPVIDRVYVVDEMEAGEVNRAHRAHSFLSGKGINVARNLRNAGARALAVTGLAESEAYLHGGDDLYRVVPVNHRARVNTVIISNDGATTNVNESPTPLRVGEWQQLCTTAIEAVAEQRAQWLVVAGSIPSPADDAAEMLSPAILVSEARRLGVLLCLDSGGHELRRWLDAGFAPDLVKPNSAELAESTGRALDSVGDVVDAAHELIAHGVRAVLASIGSDGAVLVTADRELWAKPPAVPVVNTTGAGDAALAGFIADLEDLSDPTSFEPALERAVAWGSLAVREVETVPGCHPEIAGIDAAEPPRSCLISEPVGR